MTSKEPSGLQTLSDKMTTNGHCGVYFHEDVKEAIEQLMSWAYKNNTIPLKDSNLHLSVADGGWVNVIKLQQAMKDIFGKMLVEE